MTRINNDIKHTEAQQLNAFLDTLTYWERVEFVTSVVKRAGVKRQTFMNWKAMACRIPDRAKVRLWRSRRVCAPSFAISHRPWPRSF